MVYFATILELATIVAYVVVIAGGKQKRETGWKVVVFLLVLVAALQCASMSIVVCSHPLFTYNELETNCLRGICLRKTIDFSQAGC